MSKYIQYSSYIVIRVDIGAQLVILAGDNILRELHQCLIQLKRNFQIGTKWIYIYRGNIYRGNIKKRKYTSKKEDQKLLVVIIITIITITYMRMVSKEYYLFTRL